MDKNDKIYSYFRRGVELDVATANSCAWLLYKPIFDEAQHVTATGKTVESVTSHAPISEKENSGRVTSAETSVSGYTNNWWSISEVLVPKIEFCG